MRVLGSLHFFYLFDVADTIDLSGLRTISGEGVIAAPLPIRPQSTPGYIQFPVPPLVAQLQECGAHGRTAAARAKFFDYGVISVRLSVPIDATWEELLQTAQALRSDETLTNAARALLAPILREIAGTLDDPHEAVLEEYLIVEINRLEPHLLTDDFLNTYSADIARLLLNEQQRLSDSEIEESLRVRFSYYDDDLAIIQWDTALIYDDAEGAGAVKDILEFANSQLLELRYYDAQLDRELDAIYAAKPVFTVRSFFGRKAAEQAGALRYMLVDVLELVDRSSNALKIIGDAYYARIYRGAAGRFGLQEWQRQVDRKLESVGDFYRYLNDQARGAREGFLEIVIVLLIAIEVVIGLLTLHR